MTMRGCVYKNCGNYINIKVRSANDVKLFSFPKNPERRQKWIELGNVPPSIPESMYYFCSDHFDKKFMAINNRRTVLVGEAIPFSYVETEIDETYGDADGNMDYYLYEINRGSGEDKQEFVDDQDIHVESTTTMTNEIQYNFHDEQPSNTLYEPEPDECVVFTDDEKDNQETSITLGSKRKLDTDIIQTDSGSSSKARILKISSLDKPSRKSFERTNAKSPQHMSTTKKPSSNSSSANRTFLRCRKTNEDEIDEDQLVDIQQVTTFIYKGEEYVQMPKEHYLNEKIEMTKKLKQMEGTVKLIKERLNDLLVDL